MIDLTLTLDELAPAFAGRPHLAEVWRKLRESPDSLGDLERLEVLLAQSRAHELKGNLPAALDLAGQALDQSRLAGEPALPSQAGALAQLGDIHLRLGHFDQAQQYAIDTLALNVAGAAQIHAHLTIGLACGLTGRVAEAEPAFLKAADLSRQLGYPLGRAQALGALSQMVYAMRGQFDLALAGATEAGRLFDEIGLPATRQLTFRLVLTWYMADRAQMRVLLDEIERVMGSGTLLEGFYHLGVGMLALDEDEPVRALTHFERLHSLAESLGEPVLAVRVRLGFSAYHRMLDQPAAALAWARDAVALAGRHGLPYVQAHSLLFQARAVWAVGDLTAAEADILNALESLTQQSDTFGQAHCALLLAAVQHAQGLPQAEATWLDAARRLQLGNFAFLLERERDLAFPLLAAYSRSRMPEVRASAEKLLAGLEKVSPRPLHVQGLGGFEVLQGRRPVPEREWPKRRAGELFRFLLLQPGFSALRESVFDALWPDQSPEAAQTQLHQATSALRRLLEPDLPDKFPSRYVQVGAERLSIQLPSGSNLDFAGFDHSMTAALAFPATTEPSARLEALEAALALYRGELFPTDRYADWPVPARERLAALHQAGLLALAQVCLDLHRPTQALEASRRVLAGDPWREDAVLLGMRACLALNDRPGALRLYLDLERSLAADLQIAPRDDLRALAASLRQS